MQVLIISLISLSLLVSCASQDRENISPSLQPTKTILAVGDSLTAGYGLPVSDSYPSQLETRLREMGYRYIVQNAGVSGDTTAGLLTRMDWLLE